MWRKISDAKYGNAYIMCPILWGAKCKAQNIGRKEGAKYEDQNAGAQNVGRKVCELRVLTQSMGAFNG